MSDQAQTSFAPEEPPARRLLNFITAHFAVFSLLGLVVTVLCSTLFVYGYLSEFDSQLIWIIEYTDILKFGLVALALISSAILAVILAMNFFYYTVFYFVALRAHEGKVQAAFIGVISFIVLAIFGLVIFWVIFGREGEVELFGATLPSEIFGLPSEIFGPLSLSAIFLLVNSFYTLSIVQGRGSIPIQRSISQLLVFLPLSLVIFGSTLGAYTKYSEGGLTHDVFLKDRQMSNVRLVLFTSHHTVVYAGTDVVVLPTSEIMKIVAHPSDQQRWPDSEQY